MTVMFCVYKHPLVRSRVDMQSCQPKIQTTFLSRRRRETFAYSKHKQTSNFVLFQASRAMAKNTLSSAFRKIDVDQYNEDNFKEDEQTELQSPPAGPDEGEVTHMLNQGKYADALRTVLSSAPLESKSQQVKDNAFNITLKVLMAIKGSQMDEIISTLDVDLLDVLMKYVYRGFEIPTEGSSGHLLVWHEKVYAVAGVGSIVRVLTDLKRV